MTWSFGKDAYGFFFEFQRPSKLDQSEDLKSRKIENLILNIIRSEDGVTLKDIATRLNKSEKTIQRYIANLIKDKKLERVGTNRHGYWRYTG